VNNKILLQEEACRGFGFMPVWGCPVAAPAV
jgi:hypothetical protein